MRLAAALALLLAAHVATAATIHVPGDQPTIQAGVNAASDGDTVLLADGTYQGLGNRDVTVVGKQIVIRSASDDPDLCVIDVQGAVGDYHRAFVMNDLPGPDAVLRSLTITGGHMAGYGAQARGGAIRVAYSSQPLFENVRFVSNVASWGGAVYATVASARFVDCEFVENRAVEGNEGLNAVGGAVSLDIAGASFVRCRFTDNQAQETGGAIVADYDYTEPVSLLGCEFEGNGAGWRAGALWAGAASITDCRFAGNSAEEEAGALWAWGPASITDCQFVGNSAEHFGALYARGGLDLVGSTFSENEALYRGGAVVTGPEPVTITDCDFFGNSSAVGSCGSLYVGAWGSPITVERCRFFSNRARWDGGAVHLSPSTTGEIRESLFVGNVAAREAGAILVESASFLVEHCTFAGNSAPEGGGIVFRPYYTDPDPELLVRHSVIAFGEAGGAILCSHPGATITCTDLIGNMGGDVLCGTDGGGNFSGDPLFCDADGGDFTLSSQSPCLPGNHPDGADCGLIGALGEGCGPVSVEPETWAEIKARYRESTR